MWRLGTALETDGKSKDALDAFIKSYTSGEADAVKYSVVESLYQKVNGNLDGLELKIGAKPASTASKFPVQTEQAVAQTTEKETSVTEPTPETKPSPTVPDTPQPIVETKPTPEVLASQTTTQTVVKTETAPTPENVEKPLSPVEIKTPEIVPDETKTESKSTEPIKNQTSESASKPLFEPIVITVPKVETAKPPTETETPKPEVKAEEPIQEKKPPVEDIESRPRIFVEKEPAQTPPCKIVASQENISISGGRGSLGVLIGFEGEGDVKEIKATSSSPGDIEITSEPEIGALSGRAFFIVKSISRKTGEFTVTFEAACGKKEISVKVR